MCSLSGNIDIGLIFPRSALGHEARGKRRPARPVYQVEFDFGISFLKLADGESRVIDDVDCDLAFRFSGFQRLLPFNLPRCSGLGSGRRRVSDQQTERGESDAEKEYLSYH